MPTSSQNNQRPLNRTDNAINSTLPSREKGWVLHAAFVGEGMGAGACTLGRHAAILGGCNQGRNAAPGRYATSPREANRDFCLTAINVSRKGGVPESHTVSHAAAW